MNPYWINPKPDTDEFLHSDASKKHFGWLVIGHVVLWFLSLAGIVFIYIYAQSAPQIQAFTANGEPAWGRPTPVGTAETITQQEEFLNLHLKEVFKYLFTRTEKGTLPALQYYTEPSLLAIIDTQFNFTKTKKGGYSQAFYIQDFEKMLGDANSRRRVYRIRGILSSHSLDGSSNTPIYLLAATDKIASSRENPLGWIVSVVLPVDSKDYYQKERNELIDEVTKPRTNDTLKTTPKSP